MKRLLAAACAATLLTGSLTACTSRNTNPTNNANGTSGTPSGTSYTAPSGRSYPSGASEDRAGYNRMTSSRTRYDGTSDGRYTAYSDGTVSPGSASTRNGGTPSRSLMDSARNFANDVGDAVRDVGTGLSNAASNVTHN